MANNALVSTTNVVGDQVIKRVDELNKVGFIMPKDYSYVNAIKASLLVLQELKDKNDKPALEVCTQASVAKALFEMVTKGLDASKNTCYFIVRGNKLNMHESYFGKVLEVKRVYPDFDPIPVVIHEGDEFEYEVDINTGYKKILKHVQKIENLDKDFVGAYIYLPTPSKEKNLYIMTKTQILKAWSKSPMKSLTTHKDFTEKMVGKTIINSACNMIINSTPSLCERSDDPVYREDLTPDDQTPETQEFHEADDAPDTSKDKPIVEVSDKAQETPKEEPSTHKVEPITPTDEFGDNLEF